MLRNPNQIFLISSPSLFLDTADLNSYVNSYQIFIINDYDRISQFNEFRLFRLVHSFTDMYEITITVMFLGCTLTLSTTMLMIQMEIIVKY